MNISDPLLLSPASTKNRYTNSLKDVDWYLSAVFLQLKDSNDALLSLSKIGLVPIFEAVLINRVIQDNSLVAAMLCEDVLTAQLKTLGQST